MPNAVHIQPNPVAAVLLGDTPLICLNEAACSPFAPDDERCLALLSVLCRRPVGHEILKPIKAAARYWASGNMALANLRLIFADLPQLSDPTDTPRLQLAAYCLDRGVAPRDLMKALDLDTSVLDKFDPGQPRVPGGNGRESGRWTGGTSEVASTPDPNSPDIPLVTLAATTGNFKYACKVLGVDPIAASDALHEAKSSLKLGGADNCIFYLETGDFSSMASI